MFIYLSGKGNNTSHTHTHTQNRNIELKILFIVTRLKKKANSWEISQFAECFPRNSACFQSLVLSESAWFLVMWGLKTAGPRLQCTIRVWKYKFSFLDSNLVHLFFFFGLYWIKKEEKRTQKKQKKKRRKKINEVCCLSGSLEASNSWILSKADVKYEWGLVWMSQAALSCQWIKEQGRGINEDSRNHIYCWAKKWTK